MKKHRIPSILLGAAMAATLSATVSLSTLAAEPAPITSPQTSLGEGSYSINVNGTYVPRAGDTVSVDVTWGEMNFTYSEASSGVWNPTDHNYLNPVTGGWSKNKPEITVTNHSDVGVAAELSFAAASGVSVTGTFYEKSAEGETYTPVTAPKATLSSAVGTTSENAPKKSWYFGIGGDPITETGSLGSITVKLAKDDAIYNEAALRAAIDEVCKKPEGGTIKLGADITLTEGSDALKLTYTGTETQTGKITLDLGGFTLSGTSTVIATRSRYGLIAIGEKISVEITNGSLNYQCGDFGAADYALIFNFSTLVLSNCSTTTSLGNFVVTNCGTLTVDSCTLDSGESGATIDNQKDMTIKGTTTVTEKILVHNNWSVTVEAGGTYSFNGETYSVTGETEDTYTSADTTTLLSWMRKP